METLDSERDLGMSRYPNKRGKQQTSQEAATQTIPYTQSVAPCRGRFHGPRTSGPWEEESGQGFRILDLGLYAFRACGFRSGGLGLFGLTGVQA